MSQTQLVRSLAEACGLNNTAARAFLDALSFAALKEVKRCGEFVVPGIGKLVRVDRKARMGRNPATGESIKIPAKKVVKFRASRQASVVERFLIPPTGRPSIARARIREAVTK